MKISGKKIGNNKKTFVIAEVGSNCKGDLTLAKEHIDAASQVGADAVKFQSLNMSKLYLSPTEDVMALYKKIDLEESLHQELKDYCDKIGTVFFSSPTYLDAVDLLANLDVSLFKIASAQVGTFPRLVDRVAKTGKPTFFSTGLADYEKLSQTVNIFEKNNNRNYAILHCNSLYPTPYKKVYLDRITTYKQMFNCPVGFSDHTDGIAIVLASVALKANIVEKHFKLDSTGITPDAPFSIGYKKFSEMVNGIRSVEQACKNKPRISLENEENTFKNDISYKIVLKNDKKQGEKFKLNDFVYLRNSKGIDASLDEFIIDKFYLAKDLRNGTLLNWDNLNGFIK